MKYQARLSIWIILGMAMLWVGLAANITYDYILDHRITPFSLLFFLALLIGFALPKMFNWPVYTNRPSRPAIFSLLILLMVLITYSFVNMYF